MKEDTNISDNRVATFLRRYIATREPTNRKLRSVRLCGSQATKQFGAVPAVYLLSDGEKSRFFGNVSCHSAWSCPKCTPIVMAQKGADIACAIDALAKKYNQYAFMITFTLPHSKYMFFEEAFNILLQTWRFFSKNKRKQKSKEYTLKLTVGEKNTKGGKAVGKAGDKKTYIIKAESWGKFCEELQIKHFVKVYEFTWSKENGWHPHIHALFWTDKKNFDKIPNYEDELLDRWWDCAKITAKKYWDKVYPTRDNKKAVEEYYTDWRKITSDGHRALYVSKDKNGHVIKQQSSYYISGWSGDAELTSSNYKSTHLDGHYTPRQILQIAYEDATKRPEMMDLYLEYMKQTYCHRRVEFAKHSGLRQIIEDWKKTEEYIQRYKKKFMDVVKERKFRVVYWFKEKLWKQIYFLDYYTDEEIIPNLLELALEENARELIEEYLHALGFELHDQTNNPMIEHIENRVFENKILNVA